MKKGTTKVKKFNPNTIYILQNSNNGIRIFCSRSITSLYMLEDGYCFDSSFLPTEQDFNELLQSGFEIIQEWK